MARFFPDLHSKNLKLTPGERRFGTALLRKLEDDYCCWVNVPIGPRQLRPDFVVLHPGRGILALEVKDWRLEAILSANRHTMDLLTEAGPKTLINPLERARAYATEITHLLERDPLLVQDAPGKYHGHLLFPWGYGVVFTQIKRQAFEATDLGEILPPEKVLFQDDFSEAVTPEDFQERLWGMFQYSFGGVLSLARIDRIRWHLFPEIRVQQGSLLPPEDPAPDGSQSLRQLIPDLVRVMDMQQEKIARNLGDGHRIVHGVAGSGKTMLLAYRCQYLSQLGMGKPILVLCFNKTLAARLSGMLSQKRGLDSVHVRHFHGWCKDMCDLYQLDLARDDRPVYERQVEAVIAGADRGRVPKAQYAALLIDEGHDFEPEWFKLLVQMIDPATNALLLLYDDAQDIYGKRKRQKTSWASLGINAQGRSTILKVNYRNTAEALNFAYQFLQQYLEPGEGSDDMPLVQPEGGGRPGQSPEVMACPNPIQETRQVTDWLEARAKQGVPYREMAILCRYNKQKARWQKALVARLIPSSENGEAVSVLTIHDSKGLEFRAVAIPELGAMPCPKCSIEEEAKLLYVALTRATEQLLISYTTESDFTRQCQSEGAVPPLKEA